MVCAEDGNFPSVLSLRFDCSTERHRDGAKATPVPTAADAVASITAKQVSTNITLRRGR